MYKFLRIPLGDSYFFAYVLNFTLYFALFISNTATTRYLLLSTKIVNLDEIIIKEKSKVALRTFTFFIAPLNSILILNF